MALTQRNRRTCYDNIAVGSAISAKERTIAGAAAATDGDKDNIAVGSDNGAERIIVAGTALLAGERVAV